MAISYFFLFVVFVIDLAEGDKALAELRCGSDGPAIRYPFRLNTQPLHCGLPGFTLSCTHNHDTVLQLPISMKFSVKEIDYQDKEITGHFSDPCFEGQLRRLNFSTSPFQIPEHFRTEDFIFLNCSSSKEMPFEIPCLSSPSHKFLAFPADVDISNYPLASCRKMYALSSVPYGVVNNYNTSWELILNWSLRKGY